ncbi:MAG TPA: carbohydrate ABC transporter permease [Candidatus Ornithomonoglobus intestinigallinarum]|uniref:Carbohydrate ABC transporter permease n=1 Tax=Candidatus Ornithomonoglobus intestinigallinarum TaxID=2840894 RepID=A0A9D1H6K1_9FIRM|nr:carbohydrate ABC transporter permease [Candidatus Ornithomonoglobus intestinigallinarum]
MIKVSKSRKVFNVFNYTFLALLAFTTLYPFIYTLSMSLSTTRAATEVGLHLYPKEVSVMAYQMVFKNKDIVVSYGNTLFRTIVGTVMGLLVTTLFAYALSRKEMPNRKFYTAVILFTMLFNGGKIPTYLVLKSLGLLDNIWVYVLPNLISAYNVIVARSFFQSLPAELHESASIDGAGEFTIFFKIIIPLSMPIIMTLALWMAVFHWNAWYDAMMYMTDNAKITVQCLLQRIIQENNSELISQGIVNPDAMQYTTETVKSATIIVSILPILAFYPFVQKYFIKGVMLGAVKG